MRVPRILRGRMWLLVAAPLAFALAGSGAALAAIGGSTAAAAVITPRQVYACVPAGHAAVTMLSTPSAKCPAGTASAIVGAQGPAGPRGVAGAAGSQGQAGAAGAAGAKGDTGATGAAGPSGVVSLASISGDATVVANIGGSWSSRHTVVKSAPLSAGTYLVVVRGDFYQEAATTATPVLQVQLNSGGGQVTAYTAPFPSGEPGGKLGVGTDGTPNGIEQVASASGIITLAADGTAEIDVFGYNVDTSGNGGGDFGVIASASIIKVTPAA